MPRVTGRQEARARMTALQSRAAIEEVGQALLWGAQQIQAEAQHLITEGSVSGKNHVPSLPGEPPNNDLGILKSGIEAVQTAPLRAEASSNAPYAVPLEAGASSINLLPRPHMGPATRNKKDEIIAKVRGVVAKHTNKRR